MLPPLGLKVGLALGGGAARGLAHLGVLRVIEREKIPVTVLTGTSIGAILGGAYCHLGGIEALIERVTGVLTSEEFKKNRINFLRETKKQRGGLLFSVANLVRRGYFYGVSTIRPSFISAEEFAGSLAAIVPDVAIRREPIRFGAVALDIETAREIVLTQGNLRRACEASSAIPGILPPVRINGRVLIDGGWVDKVPVLPAFQLGADVVIAVDIAAALEDARDYNRGVNIMVRANAIKDSALVRYSRRLADVLVEPDVKSVHWADFSAWERCVEAGERATERAVPEIRQLLRHERLFSMVRPGHGKRLADLHLSSEELGICVE